MRREIGMTDSNDSDEIDRQTTRGFLHTHTHLSQGFANLFELASTLFGVVDVLIARGMITTEEIETSIEAARVELRNSDFGRGIQFELNPDARDKYAPEIKSPDIDCADRVHLCRAACCSLDVLLTEQDVTEGKVAWDPGEPYRNRRRTDGYCSHLAPDGRGCDVYACRPVTCRTYDCRDDERIWASFEERRPNAAGIQALLERNVPLAMGSATPQFKVAQAHSPEDDAQ
ncbi:MAG: Fe-S-cluster containining protein [Myxococcota bacterium]